MAGPSGEESHAGWPERGARERGARNDERRGCSAPRCLFPVGFRGSALSGELSGVTGSLGRGLPTPVPSGGLHVV